MQTWSPRAPVDDKVADQADAVITAQTLSTSAEWTIWWNRSRGTFKPKK